MKCRLCDYCDGFGCIGELPGMGGEKENRIFQKNVLAWDLKPAPAGTAPAIVRLAPLSGGVENVGYKKERDFYFDLIGQCSNCNTPLSIGDGHPIEKLKHGVSAVSFYGDKCATFIKPWRSNREIFKRIEISSSVSEIVGIDIDSYLIKTIGKNRLEEKTASQLIEIKKRLTVPFAVKGIISLQGISLIKEVRPDIVVVSNHGGRVPGRIIATADFLGAFASDIKKYCGEVWVDGGIRSVEHAKTARALGASCVLVGRPVISSMLRARQ